ncbi:HTH domain-containing protein [Halomicroarcula sp. GCM10025709]|uniref:HTH domain-containing protein n=1 Tax=Halomicroarcula sp. GCM10025709 TaxID=3252669 RepID=UPI0036204BA3
MLSPRSAGCSGSHPPSYPVCTTFRPTDPWLLLENTVLLTKRSNPFKPISIEKTDSHAGSRRYRPEPAVEPTTHNGADRPRHGVSSVAGADQLYSSQERLVERLQSLVDAGYIDELTVTVWGEQVCTEGALSTVTDCSQIIQAIGDFFALAADSSVEVAPFFRVKEISSSLSGEEFNCISTPARCVAFYTAESLLGVYPCKVDGVVYTPEDALTQLERLTDEEHQQARA